MILKKATTIFLAFIFCFSLVGCERNNKIRNYGEKSQTFVSGKFIGYEVIDDEGNTNKNKEYNLNITNISNDEFDYSKGENVVEDVALKKENNENRYFSVEFLDNVTRDFILKFLFVNLKGLEQSETELIKYVDDYDNIICPLETYEYKDSDPYYTITANDKTYIFYKEIFIKGDPSKNPENNKIKTVNFKVNIFYSNSPVPQDMTIFATILLDDSRIFFKYPEYGINNLVAGDCIEIKYKGTFEKYGHYPYDIDMGNMKILKVTKKPASAFPLKITKIENGFIYLDSLGNKTSFKDLKWEIGNKQLINKDESLEIFSEKHIGTIVYGTDSPATPSIEVEALYSYNPLSSR